MLRHGAGLENAGRLLALGLLVFLVMGCARSLAYPEIHLKDLEPLPSRIPQPIGEPPLRVAIASVISPRGTIESYGPFLTYLSERLGRRVELIQRQTYAETNELIARASVEMAFVCTGAYLEGRRDKGMELLVVPQVKGETVYYSYIIVPQGSPAQSLDDLKGKAFAFTDPLSNTGRLAAVYRLWQMGQRPETFFSRYIYTFSHDNSIQAVADRLVDGASVDSLVYHFVLERDPRLAEKVRVIQRSPPYGIPPVVVPVGLDVHMKDQLRHLLLTMHQDERGRKALAEIQVDRFVLSDESAYDSVQQMLDAVGRP